MKKRILLIIFLGAGCGAPLSAAEPVIPAAGGRLEYNPGLSLGAEPVKADRLPKPCAPVTVSVSTEKESAPIRPQLRREKNLRQQYADAVGILFCTVPIAFALYVMVRSAGQRSFRHAGRSERISVDRAPPDLRVPLPSRFVHRGHPWRSAEEGLKRVLYRLAFHLERFI